MSRDGATVEALASRTEGVAIIPVLLSLGAQQPTTGHTLAINKRRNTRIKFTGNEQGILLEVFRDHKYISRSTLEELAIKLHTTGRRVQIWFQNMRAKSRRDGKDLELLKRQRQTREDALPATSNLAHPNYEALVALLRNDYFQSMARQEQQQRQQRTSSATVVWPQIPPPEHIKTET